MFTITKLNTTQLQYKQNSLSMSGIVRGNKTERDGGGMEGDSYPRFSKCLYKVLFSPPLFIFVSHLFHVAFGIIISGRRPDSHCTYFVRHDGL